MTALSVVHFDSNGNQTSSFTLPRIANNTSNFALSYRGISRSANGFHLYYYAGEKVQLFDRVALDGASYRFRDSRNHLNIAKLDINGRFIVANI